MRVYRRISELKRDPRLRLGFVPTMGAFHEGHLELMRHARRDCDEVGVSIFVNPTQFGPNEDFESYPRDLERDLSMANSVGVAWIFAPEVAEIYPRKAVSVHAAGVTERWEGEVRPGHFDGVATIVLKLFNIVGPDLAYFGLKDYQQCIVVKRMVDDLNIPVELKFVETVREPSGLAMSSRNAHLSASQRQQASSLYEQLRNAAAELSPLSSQTEQSVARILEMARQCLLKEGLSTDYFALVDAESLLPWTKGVDNVRLIAAARMGTIRLIDNCSL